VQEHNLHPDEIAFLRLRWKEPGEDVSALAEMPLINALAPSFDEAGIELRFSAAVAAFGQRLRGNPELSTTNWSDIATWANNARGSDEGGFRAELVRLVGLAESVAR